ncbi:MAG: heavy metal translocating P-type ATPase [Isosphaerales bacterium]
MCDYCELPLPASWRGGPATPDQDEALYCCLGCRIAAAIVEEQGEDGVPRTMLARLGLSIFFTMNVMAFTMALWTTDVYATTEPPTTLAIILNGLFRYIVLLFSLPVLLFLGLPLFDHAWNGLRRGVLSTDWLLASGVAAAFAFSFLSVFQGRGPIYFEVGCVILVLTTLGRWLEATGKRKAGAALDALTRLLPDQVRRVSDGQERLVPRAEIMVDDRLHVLPGERFPADGRVVRHAGLVDERVLTGESRPVLKETGDRILGGTLNLDGDLTIQVTEAGDRGTLARVVEMVRVARESKGRYQRLADRFASRFVPAVSAVALLAFAAHWALGSLERGLWAGLAVSVIACPCALGLAAPLAVWSALGNAAGQRVLFRSGEALERLADIVAVRFDKTGTLTTGAATVSRFVLEHADQLETTLAQAAALAAVSPHAMSHAIAEFARARQVAPSDDVSDVRLVPGKGAIGTLAPWRSRIVLGSSRFLMEQGFLLGHGLSSAHRDAESRGLPVTLVGWDGQARGLFVLDEEWRPAARAVIHWLTQARLDVGVLTGDHATRGRIIAGQLGVVVEAELLPAQKVAAIERARRAFGPVSMIGDGINDAPALSASDVGIALGCGTDVSRDSASICLLGDDLSRIPWSIELARRTRRVIRWNLIWAFGYNSVGVACAALGWLNPALAAFLMVASGSLVTINSLRLGRPFEVELDGSSGIPATASSPDVTVSAPLPRRSQTIEGSSSSNRPIALEPTAR